MLLVSAGLSGKYVLFVCVLYVFVYSFNMMIAYGFITLVEHVLYTCVERVSCFMLVI